jgi:hypothetical protein
VVFGLGWKGGAVATDRPNTDRQANWPTGQLIETYRQHIFSVSSDRQSNLPTAIKIYIYGQLIDTCRSDLPTLYTIKLAF